MSPLGAMTTSHGWLNWPGPRPATPASPRRINSSPSGLNLITWWPLVPSSLPSQSVTHTLPSPSTWKPCGVTNRPAPKLVMTSPVWRLNLNTGSRCGAFSQACRSPPLQRS